MFEFRDGHWIGNEGQACSTLDDLVDGNVQFFGKIAQNRENGESCQEWRKSVSDADDECVAVDVVTEFVVRWIVDESAETNGQWKEGLSYCLIPNLGRWCNIENKISLSD